MIKMKYWAGGLLFAVSAACLTTSCKDDTFPPITLHYTQEGDSPLSADNILSISPFMEEVKFSIQGGNGLYSIESNDNHKVADYRYDGKGTLTILPKELGETNLVITDYAGNRYMLRIVVAYPETVYSVKRVAAHITGDNLTLKERNAIAQQIKENSVIRQGGTYVFTYTNQIQTEGKVKIYATEDAATPQEGIFTQNRPITGTEEVSIRITLTSGSQKDYTLGYYPTDYPEYSPVVMMKENVTDTYKGTYPALNEAYEIQLISEEQK